MTEDGGRKDSRVAWGRTGLRLRCSCKKDLVSPAGNSGTQMTLLGVRPTVGLEKPLSYQSCAQSGLALPAKRVTSAGTLRFNSVALSMNLGKLLYLFVCLF